MNFIPGNGAATVKAGAAYNLIVQFKNDSTNEGFSGSCSMGIETDARTGFALAVIPPSGGDVSPPSIDGLPGGGSGGVFACEPNRISAIRWPMGLVYKLNKAGTYNITARRAFNRKEKPYNYFRVVSDPLLVKVIPDE